MDVLYGAQEATGIERGYNTHFFAYTPAVARAMAEGVSGLEDVEIKTDEEDNGLGYNMIITGKKPEQRGEQNEDAACGNAG